MNDHRYDLASRFDSSRPRRTAVGALVMLLGLCLLACGPPPPRPNIVLISLDTLRADHLGVYGYDRDLSPNLDRMAARGVVFRNHYSQAPNTAPSHTSVLTGLFPSVPGIWGHGELLDPAVPVIPEMFREAGYTTAAFVQLPGESYKRGFDVYTGLSHDASFRRRAEATMDAVYEFVEAPREEPFFLFLHTYSVHLPYNPPQEFADRYWGDYDGTLGKSIRRGDVDRINERGDDVTDADRQHVVDMYDAEIATLDHDLGAMFDRFEAQGLFDDTIFAIIADHGEEFGDHGLYGRHTYSLYEELLRTPLIMFGPGVPEGVDVEMPSRNLDVAPTLLRMAGIDAPQAMQGFDLEPLWDGTETEPRVVLAEKKEYRVFIVDGFKYDTDVGALYDLRQDPGELFDVREEYPDKVVEFERLIAAWETELARAAANVGNPGAVQLSPEEVRRLRALGYLR